MIQVEGLSISYFGNPLFQDATFSLQRGERCGLVGRNGSGKSTLFRLITKKETPDSGTISIGRNYSIGMLDQHILFTQSSVIEEAALGLKSSEKDCLYKVERILFGLGFTHQDLIKNPKDLSGGYQLRLHLAKVLISEPDCLLLDEPTNYLDIISIRWFTRFLRQWKGEFILITHDRQFMDSVTTHMMGIHRSKVRKIAGSTNEFFDLISQEEEIYERTRVNSEKKRERVLGFVERFGAKASKASQAQSKRKMLERIPSLEKLKALYNLSFSFKEAPFFGQKMVEVRGVDFSFDPQVGDLVHDLSFSIEKGERIAIVGKNGRGKSTLLRLLAKELNPLSGSIFASEHVKIGYFGQTNIDRLSHCHTVEEEIASANVALTHSEVRAICGLMMFSGMMAEKPISVLSGGERSRVLLGKIVGTPCNLLLLDEPTHHLDVESIEALIDALEEFSQAVVIVTHSELLLERLALDKIIVCHQGRQELFLGGYEAFLEKDGWKEEEALPSIEKVKVQKELPKKSTLQKTSSWQQKRIKALEEEIIQLEVDQEADQKVLFEASNKKDISLLQSVGKRIADRKERIDSLFLKLEALF